jgi:hypothetical protein
MVGDQLGERCRTRLHFVDRVPGDEGAAADKMAEADTPPLMRFDRSN